MWRDSVLLNVKKYFFTNWIKNAKLCAEQKTFFIKRIKTKRSVNCCNAILSFYTCFTEAIKLLTFIARKTITINILFYVNIIFTITLRIFTASCAFAVLISRLLCRINLFDKLFFSVTRSNNFLLVDDNCLKQAVSFLFVTIFKQKISS